MSLKPKLFKYFDHFGSTVPLRELHDQPDRTNVIALRHDIDHDLDLALEVAHHEHARGLRATYFLLHTNQYWNDERLLIKCRQLQEYGHEVALHVNLLTQWFNGQCNDLSASLQAMLKRLREGGISVTGISAHGDKACYAHQFINYWLFRELRGDDPVTSQRGRCPEGITVAEPTQRISYPTDHLLRRDDGAEFPLWSISMSELGLQYDGAHLPVDHYWTDSGGAWTRSSDPLLADLSRGRHQVLMHPVWWCAPKKIIFVMSTGRAGSTWLANFVDKATSCRGLHEWTLNHRQEANSFVHDKHTNTDYQALVGDPRTSSKLIQATQEFIRRQRRDVLEANVYLEPFIGQLQAAMPESIFIHLHRNGRDVVRSILNRGWYSTPFDRRHRAVPIMRWKHLTQFQRACWYYRFVNERLQAACSRRWSFEDIASDQRYLTSLLNDLGIVVHPLLAADEFARKLNACAQFKVPPYDRWPSDWKSQFDEICGQTQHELGYSATERTGPPTTNDDSSNDWDGGARVLVHIDFASANLDDFSAKHVDIETSDTGVVIVNRAAASAASHLLLARGRWNRVESTEGLNCSQHCAFSGRIKATVPSGPLVRLFALFYDSDANQIGKRRLAICHPDNPYTAFDFSPAEGCSHMALAVHITQAQYLDRIVLHEIEVLEHELDGQYRIAWAVEHTNS